MRAKTIALLTAGCLAAGGLSFAGGWYFAPEKIRTRTETVTNTETVEVPGPVRWRTKKVEHVPSSCRQAIDAGADMAQLLDDYNGLIAGELDKMYVDMVSSLNVVFQAGQAFIADVQAVKSSLDDVKNRYFTIRDRADDLNNQWQQIPWYAPAENCGSAA